MLLAAESRGLGIWLGKVKPRDTSYLGLTEIVYSLNERLSFLRYESGHYFRPHCDGQLRLPDGRCARVTLQIYLGGGEVEGGATRIIGKDDRYVDIEPKRGRVLIFQQRDLYHSGEDVTKGVKYALRSDFMFRPRPLNAD